MALILVNAIQTDRDLTVDVFGWDKLNHLIAFLTLSVLGYLAYAGTNEPWKVSFCLLGYGLGIEVIQGMVPGRTTSLNDLLADGCGILLFYLLLPVLDRLPLFRKLRQC